jgi:hypothetical protein
MRPTVAECLEHDRECKWYAARTMMKGIANSFFGGPKNG